MYKKKIVYFPEGDLPRIYVNPKNEAALLRTYRAVHLTQDMENKLIKHPLHKWKFDVTTKTISVCNDIAEERIKQTQPKLVKQMEFREQLIVFALSSILIFLMGYMVGFSYQL